MRAQAEALAKLLSTYRQGEIVAPDADHVERWVNQFDPADRVPLLEELHHVWSKLFLRQDLMQKFLARKTKEATLTGADPEAFWKSATVLDIQAKGESQRDMRRLFSAELKAALGLDIDACGGGLNFVYFDDVLFTGDRVKADLRNWMQTAPNGATAHVVLVGAFTLGKYLAERDLKAAALAGGKGITFRFHQVVEFENRKAHRNDSIVLWPTSLPPEAVGYDQGNTGFLPRTAGTTTKLFSSPDRRNLIEQAMLKAGLKIRGFSATPSAILRPLGYGPFGVGFGSLVLTYRNCPSNAPLALWWGDPTKPSWHPLSKWYPLVPRRTYGGDENG
jgi:hypothetical protein